MRAPPQSAPQTTAATLVRPSDDELDMFGITDRGKVRPDNQDHFLVCTVHPQVVIHGTSLSGAESLPLRGTRLASMFEFREAVHAGGLLSYGASSAVNYRRTAYFVDRILRGANPAGLPVEQPSAFQLVVNLRTAKSLGVAIPQSILLRADEVIA